MRVKLFILAATSAAAISAMSGAAVAQDKIGPSAMNNGREPNPATPTYQMQRETTGSSVRGARNSDVTMRSASPAGGRDGGGGATGSGGGGGGGGAGGGGTR